MLDSCMELSFHSYRNGMEAFHSMESHFLPILKKYAFCIGGGVRDEAGLDKKKLRDVQQERECTS